MRVVLCFLFAAACSSPAPRPAIQNQATAAIPDAAAEPRCDPAIREGTPCSAPGSCTLAVDPVIYCGVTVGGYDCRDGTWHEIQAICPGHGQVRP
jgi:hypothetical protein